MRPSLHRPAIAMVELIFAIVVMGIVMLPAPMLISTATQSTFVGLQQEGINEAASKVNMIMSYPWDEGDADVNGTPPILHVSNGNAQFEPEATKANHTRKGIPVKSSRAFKNGANASTTLGLDGGEATTSDADDIDDFNNESLTSLFSVESATTDYTEKSTVQIDTKISYGKDDYTDGGSYSYVPFRDATTTTTNVKNITVKLTSTDTSNTDALGKEIVLHAFSCNIGGLKLAERWF